MKLSLRSIYLTLSSYQDVTKYPDLVASLLKRGATDQQVRNFAGENILRVWAHIEKVGEQIRTEGTKASLPNEAVWDGRSWTRGHNWLPFMFSGSKFRLHGNFKGEKPKASDFNIKT